MLLIVVMLLGCTEVATTPEVPRPPERFPFGLDPDVCVPGTVSVGESFGDFVMTQEELQPYRCLGGLQVRNVGDLELPNLEVVEGPLQAVWLPDHPPVDVSLPSLRRASSLLLLGGRLRSIDVGQLRSLGLLSVGTNESGDLTDFAGLESISQLMLNDGINFSGLQISSTRLLVTGGVSTLSGLGNLTEVELSLWSVEMDNVLGLDNVVRLRTLEVHDSSVDTLDGLGSVLTAGSISVMEVSDLVSLSPLSTLQSVDVDILIDGADGLVSVGLIALTQVGGDLHVQSTTATTIDLPLLTAVGGDVVFRDNPNLPACEVERLVTRLQAAGFTGAVENSGNDTEAVCSDP